MYFHFSQQKKQQPCHIIFAWPSTKLRRLLSDQINYLTFQVSGNREFSLAVSTDCSEVMYQAVRRLVERNGITEEEAVKRLISQMSNKERVNRANVVLCTLWHPDVTQQQVSSVLTVHWLSVLCAAWTVTALEAEKIKIPYNDLNLSELKICNSALRFD